MARTTTVHLLTGDYPDRLDSMVREAKAAAEDKTPRTGLEVDLYAEMERAYDELKAEAIEAGITVHLAAVSRRKWRALKEKYPPRSAGEGVTKEDAENDRIAGLDTDGAEDDLVFESIKAWEEATGEKAEQAPSRSAFNEWADTLSEGEWVVVSFKCWELANGARLDPKDHLPSRTRSDG